MFRKLLPGLIVATGVALVAGGAAVAFGGGGDPDEDLLANVAERLGLEPSQVEEAFAQARREETDESVGELLTRLVEAGRITQQQSDEALSWFEARPDSVDKLSLLGLAGGLLKSVREPGDGVFAFPGHLPPGVHDFEIPADVRERMAEALGIDIEELEQAFSDARAEAAAEGRLEVIKAQIDRLVESDKLTEAEGDELKAWVDEMPVWLAGVGLPWSFLGDDFGRFAPGLHELRGFGVPRGDVEPDFHFEFRPHRFQFRPGFETPADPTPTPTDAATGVSRPA